MEISWNFVSPKKWEPCCAHLYKHRWDSSPGRRMQHSVHSNRLGSVNLFIASHIDIMRLIIFAAQIGEEILLKYKKEEREKRHVYGRRNHRDGRVTERQKRKVFQRMNTQKIKTEGRKKIVENWTNQNEGKAKERKKKRVSRRRRRN